MKNNIGLLTEPENLDRDDVRSARCATRPGDIRQLEHVIERAVITSQGSVLRLAEIINASWTPDREVDLLSISDIEREHILTVLGKTGNTLSRRLNS